MNSFHVIHLKIEPRSIHFLFFYREKNENRKENERERIEKIKGKKMKK